MHASAEGLLTLQFLLGRQGAYVLFRFFDSATLPVGVIVWALARLHTFQRRLLMLVVCWFL